MAFNWTTMTDAVAAQLAQVPGIGQVHKQRRIMRTADDLKALGYVKPQDRINVWMISPAASNATITDRQGGASTVGTIGGGIQGSNAPQMLQTLQFQIEGWFGLKDGDLSETQFRDLAYAVTMRFNRIGSLTPDVSFQLPCDMDTFGYTMFAGGILTHYARISFGVRGRVL